MGGKRSINQTGRVGKEGAECTGQVKLGKQVKMVAEPGRQGQDGGNLLGIRGDVQTMSV